MPAGMSTWSASEEVVGGAFSLFVDCEELPVSWLNDSCVWGIVSRCDVGGEEGI